MNAVTNIRPVTRKIDRIVAADKALAKHEREHEFCHYPSQRAQCPEWRRLDAACDAARK